MEIMFFQDFKKLVTTFVLEILYLTVERDHAGSKRCLKTEGFLPLPKIYMELEDDFHLRLSHLWLSSIPALRFGRFNNLTV